MPGTNLLSCCQQLDHQQQATNTSRHGTTGSAGLWSWQKGNEWGEPGDFSSLLPRALPEDGVQQEGNQTEHSGISELRRLEAAGRSPWGQSCTKRTLDICRDLGWELICKCVTGGIQGWVKNHGTAVSSRPPEPYGTGNSVGSLKPKQKEFIK